MSAAKHSRAFTLVEVMIVGVIFVLLLAMAIPACQKVRAGDKPDRELYQSWLKLTKREDVSFDEWRRLRAANLLPTQSNDARN